MMRAPFAAGLAMLLAACGPKPPQAENQIGASEKSVAADSNGPSVPAATASHQANTAAPGKQAGVLPPVNASVRYLGTWATSPENCKSKPWRFTRDALEAKDGPRCNFYNVAQVPGGYDIAAQCPTKEPIHTDLIKLRFAESAGAMLVESNAIAPTGLIYCGK